MKVEAVFVLEVQSTAILTRRNLLFCSWCSGDITSYTDDSEVFPIPIQWLWGCPTPTFNGKWAIWLYTASYARADRRAEQD